MTMTNQSKVAPMTSENAEQEQLVTCTIVKETPYAKTGIVLEQMGMDVSIGNIVPGRLAATTDLRPGMTLVSINDMQCQGCKYQQVAQLLMDSVGPVTIVASVSPLAGHPKKKSNEVGNVETSTKRSESESKCHQSASENQNKQPKRTQRSGSKQRSKGVLCERFGIRLADEGKDGNVLIVQVLEASPLAKSRKTNKKNKAKAGMTIVSIHGESCKGKTAAQVASRLDNLVAGRVAVVLGLPNGATVRTTRSTRYLTLSSSSWRCDKVLESVALANSYPIAF